MIKKFNKKIHKMKKLYTALLFAGLFSTAIQAQGLIVNEMSNGTSAAKEYVELLVIGGTGVEFAPVDLRGWILDDNNGSFQTSVGTGVAPGHFRIAASCAALTAVPVGSIILIYNADDKEASFPADDLTDANNDKVYVFPHTAACLEVCTSSPNATGSVTTYTGCTYQSTTTAAVNSPRSWAAIGFGNAADAVQIRKPDLSFFHGFAYGSITAPFPAFPAALGGGNSFNVASGTNALRSNILNCGAWNNGANYNFIAAATQTPAAANNAANATLINNIRTGNYIYANPSDPNNCILTLPIYLQSFDAKAVENYNQIHFSLNSDEDFATVVLEKSQDGLNFEYLAEFFITEKQILFQRDFIDNQPFALSYYRLKMVETNGKTSYSNVQAVRHSSNNAEADLLIYPNPTQNILNIEFINALQIETQIEIINTVGQIQHSQIVAAGNNLVQIQTLNLASGAYFIRIQQANSLILKRFIRH
jgi:Secretion system C-terminal sorting domain